MRGTVWHGITFASGVIAIALGIYLGDATGIIVGICAAITGAGLLWHNDRFVRTTRR